MTGQSWACCLRRRLLIDPTSEMLVVCMLRLQTLCRVQQAALLPFRYSQAGGMGSLGLVRFTTPLHALHVPQPDMRAMQGAQASSNDRARRRPAQQQGGAGGMGGYLPGSDRGRPGAKQGHVPQVHQGHMQQSPPGPGAIPRAMPAQVGPPELAVQAASSVVHVSLPGAPRSYAPGLI